MQNDLSVRKMMVDLLPLVSVRSFNFCVSRRASGLEGGHLWTPIGSSQSIHIPSFSPDLLNSEPSVNVLQSHNAPGGSMLVSAGMVIGSAFSTCG